MGDAIVNFEHNILTLVCLLKICQGHVNMMPHYYT